MSERWIIARLMWFSFSSISFLSLFHSVVMSFCDAVRVEISSTNNWVVSDSRARFGHFHLSLSIRIQFVILVHSHVALFKLEGRTEKEQEEHKKQENSMEDTTRQNWCCQRDTECSFLCQFSSRLLANVEEVSYVAEHEHGCHSSRIFFLSRLWNFSFCFAWLTGICLFVWILFSKWVSIKDKVYVEFMIFKMWNMDLDRRESIVNIMFVRSKCGVCAMWVA